MSARAGDRAVTAAPVRRGALRRVARMARPFRGLLALYLLAVVLGGLATMAGPLALRGLIDQGVVARQRSAILLFAAVVASLALADAILRLSQRWLSARIGEGLTFVMRSAVYRNIQRQPLAFFTRTRTGSLVGRLNSDLFGAQRAFTDLLANVIGNAFVVGFVLLAMAALSWPLTVACLLAIPLLAYPARVIGRRLATLTYERHQASAALNTMMTERFNVSGATLTRLFAEPARDAAELDERAAQLRDLGVEIAVRGRALSVALALLGGLAAAVVYGWGGLLAVEGAFQVGTLVAMSAYLGRIYVAIAGLSGAHVDVATMLVSFQRVFEVLDLEPLVAERAGAVTLPRGPTRLELDHVDFAYPPADRVSVASLEAVLVLDDRPGEQVLHDVSFRVEPGELVALVGPSGAGKTTISMLVSRLYDVDGGAVRLGGTDVRDATFASLRAKVGVVPQDSHLFHDTLRANLLLARPSAAEEDLRQALAQAQIGDVVDALPDGLDTIVGERGHRLSAGEKQRIALARIILKEPDVVILDEATAHLDAGSEAAVRRALAIALAGRTSLVIAHRLATIRGADRIVVVDRGRIVDHGTHAELVGRGGLYALLHRLQFDDTSGSGREPVSGPGRG